MITVTNIEMNYYLDVNNNEVNSNINKLFYYV